MELVAGILLWFGDVLGIKWVKEESNTFKKVVKAVTFLLVGVILVIVYFVLFA